MNAPKPGDTVVTANGNTYTCVTQAEVVAFICPGQGQRQTLPYTYYGATFGDDGKIASWIGWDFALKSLSNPSYHVTKITPKAMHNPKPGDIIITNDNNAWVCCTREHLKDTYGLSADSEDDIFAFRIEVTNQLGLAWMSWGAENATDTSVDHDYRIKRVIAAKCNKRCFHGPWERKALLAYIATLPEAIHIGEDGYVQ